MYIRYTVMHIFSFFFIMINYCIVAGSLENMIVYKVDSVPKQHKGKQRMREYF